MEVEWAAVRVASAPSQEVRIAAGWQHGRHASTGREPGAQEPLSPRSLASPFPVY